MANEKYFNVPIQLFEGFMTNPVGVLNNVFDYAIYEHSLELNGDEAKRFQDALHWYGVTSPNHNYAIHNGKMLMQKHSQLSPKIGISKEMFFDFYNNYKTDFEKICLLAYLALKSIIQKKSFCCITNSFWLARMDGKPKAVKDFKELSVEIFKYSNEYQMVKIKKELRDSWHLKFYSYHMRGCFYSFSETLSYENLVLQAEKTRKKNKEIAARKVIQHARNKALAQIYGE